MSIFKFPELKNVFENKSLFYFTLFVLFVIYVSLLVFRLDAITIINEDEIWYYIVGKNLLNHGNMIDHNNSNAFFSLQNIALGLIGELVGERLFYFRMFSVVVGVFTMIIYYKSTKLLVKLWDITHENLFIIVSLIVFISQALNIMIFRLARPEALSAFFLHAMFWSFLNCLYKMTQLKSSIYNALFFSFFVFLAVFTHLNNTIPALVLSFILFTSSLLKFRNAKFSILLSVFLIFFAVLYILLLYLLKNINIVEYFQIISQRSSIGAEGSNSIFANTLKFVSKYNYNFLRSPIWITEILSLILLFVYFRKQTFLTYIWTLAPILILIFSLLFFNQFSIRHFTVFYLFLYLSLSVFIYKTLLKPKLISLTIIGLFLINSFAITFMFFAKDRNNKSFSLVENEFENKKISFDSRVVAGNLAQLHLFDNYKEFYSLSHLHRKNEDIHSIVKVADVIILNDWDKRAVPHHGINVDQIVNELNTNSIKYTIDTMTVTDFGKSYIISLKLPSDL